MKPQGWRSVCVVLFPSCRVHGEFEVLKHMKLIVFYKYLLLFVKEENPFWGTQ